MPDATGRAGPGRQLAGLRSRSAALRQAAALPQSDTADLLDAALAELDLAAAAIAAGAGQEAGRAADEPASSESQHAERRLLHAVFTHAPIPLLVADSHGTVRRANAAMCTLLGVAQGYATGKSLAALIEPGSRAALKSRLAVVTQTGKPATMSCRLLARNTTVTCKLAISPLLVRGDADRLLVAVSTTADPATTVQPAKSPPAAAGKRRNPGTDDTLAAATRRFDLLTAAARLLHEHASSSESVLLQRTARLLASELTSWVIVDVHRRGLLRRNFVAGPDTDHPARLDQVIAAVNPAPGSVSYQVNELGSAVLISHPEDDDILGTGQDGTPLLPLLGAGSVLSVPVADGDRRYGVLTLARPVSAGQFSLAESGLAEEICGLLALAISARRMLRRHTDAADALRASLLPPVLKAVPGVEIASAHMAPTRGREVGGDFYDVYPTPGGWGVAIGDVCGKGEDAAAATAAARHAIRVLGHWNGDPAGILRGANEIMLAEEFGGRFVTADAVHLSWHDGILRAGLATAGHPGPVLLRPDGAAQVIAGGGLPLGIFPDPEPATHDLELAPGDVLFFYTDGLTGARSRQGITLEDGLADTLADLAGRHPADIVAELRKQVLEFCDGVLLDDLTMLALQVGQPPG